jgi:hypothetical protein
MSLDISIAIELEDAEMFGEAPVLYEGQQGMLTMAVWDALNDINTQIKAQDLQEANANKTKMGEKASQDNKVVHHGGMENSSGAMNTAEAPATFPEAPHSAVVNQNADWAGLFYEGEEDPIAEDQEFFTEQETSSTDGTVSSNDQAASPPDQTASFSKRLGPDAFDHCMITDDEVDEAFKQFDEQDDERKTLDEMYPLLKASIRFLDSPPSSPPTSPRGNIQNLVKQVEQPVRQVKQPIHQVETHVHQVEVPHPVEQTICQVQPSHQAQLLHAEEQTVRPVDTSHQVKELVNPVRQSVHQIQSAHPIKLPLGKLHLPVHQSQPVNQIHQPGLDLPQNNAGLQQGTKNTRGMAKKATRASKIVTKSVPTTMFIDAQHVAASHIPQKIVADFQYYGEPEIMDGALAHESNEHSYIVPKEQSEHGLAGLFGLTLDQAKSGMRNKKAGVRNTMIEKPKVCLRRIYMPERCSMLICSISRLQLIAFFSMLEFESQSPRK